MEYTYLYSPVNQSELDLIALEEFNQNIIGQITVSQSFSK